MNDSNDSAATESANTYRTEGHTSAPWNPYSTFGHLVESSGGRGIHLSPEDYDFAAQCINAHDALIAAVEGLLLLVPPDRSDEPPSEWPDMARAAVKLARGEA